MFRTKTIKDAATAAAARLKPSKKQAPQKHGFEVLQSLEEENVDYTLANSVNNLAISSKTEAATAAPTNSTPTSPQPSGQDDGEGWSKVKERQSSKATDPKTPTHSLQRPSSEAPWLRNDWRSRANTKTEFSRFAAAKTIDSTWTKGTHRPGPRTKAGVLFADQIAGTIVFRPDVRKFKSKKVPDSDPRIYYEGGVRYLKKGRYWLIVKSTSKQVWEAPIYTNNDTGLATKSTKEKKEHFSLRPRAVAPEVFHNQSPANKVFSIGYMDERDGSMKGRKMRLTMVVHFTEIYSRSIDNPDVRVVGALAKEDIAGACDKAAPYVKA